MKFIKLKSTKFSYLNKTYTEDRYISEDHKIVIMFNKLDYVRIFFANEQGMGKIQKQFYYKRDMNGYPIYTLDSIPKDVKIGKLKNKFVIHESQFPKKQIKKEIELARLES